jgi:hypothetical protein
MEIKIKKSLMWAILISIGFMVVLLLRIEWKHFSLIAGRFDIKYLIISCIVYILANLVRAFRFCKLDHKDNKLFHWWHINAFYNFMTATLPGGAGEAATAYILKRFSKFNLLSALRILLLSRFMDVFSLSMLFFSAAMLISSATPYREAAIWFSGAAFLISSIALLRSSEQFVMKLLQRLPGQNKLVQRVCEKLSELLKIAEEQRSSNLFGITLFLSVLMMFGNIVSTHYALRSFGVDLLLVQTFYCFGVYAIFQIVPVQGIAGIGTQAAWWTLALNAAGYDSPESLASGFVMYAINYIFATFLGLFSLLFWFKGSGTLSARNIK